MYVVATDQVGPSTVTNMHQTSIDGTADMSKLGDLHEGAILHNIHKRYASDQIYTYIGSILSAVNPYKKLDCFGDREIDAYNKKALGDLPPHIYAIANEAYYNMWKDSHSQVVLISGAFNFACIYACMGDCNHPHALQFSSNFFRRVWCRQDRVDQVYSQVYLAPLERGQRRRRDAWQALLRGPASRVVAHPRGLWQRQDGV
jgi:hypothetical protein